MIVTTRLAFVFLIHYGWRGTRISDKNRIRKRYVSNPLRLEGDAVLLIRFRIVQVVSNPLRLEGDP